jgi:hypothetical protein
MKTLTNLSRWIFGLVFIFSGFVKGIDPWGLEYKLADYLPSMGLGVFAFWLLPGLTYFPWQNF